LGIGVNTAILSAVNGVVLRPLPADKPTELITPHWEGKQTRKFVDNLRTRTTWTYATKTEAFPTAGASQAVA
jgi:hypothetical protein